MALKPNEEIGAEIHNKPARRFSTGFGHPSVPASRVPAGAKHNIINTGTVPLKLYTLYAPPNHRDGVVHATKAEAEADKEHFDGKTTE